MFFSLGWTPKSTHLPLPCARGLECRATRAGSVEREENEKEKEGSRKKKRRTQQYYFFVER
jgi:hypothetical protein